MSKMNDHEQPIDPHLVEKIQLLEQTPERDPILASQTREKFTSQLDGIPAVAPRSPLDWFSTLFKGDISKLNTNPSKNRKFAFSTIMVLVVAVVVLFGGASVTAYASQSALPGDALYPVKTGIESTQITLANDAYVKAQLNLEFAQRRMEEISALLQQGRTGDVDFASMEFEKYIQKAMEDTQIVIASDPERGAELSKLVSKALLDYAVALKSVLVNVPDVVKPAVEKALTLSTDGAGEEIEIFGSVTSISETEIEVDGEVYLITQLTELKDTINVGDAVKIHVIQTADGLLIAREIELFSQFSGEDNQNGNSNENEDFSDDNNNESFNDNSSGEDLNENEIEDSGNDNEAGDDHNSNESNDNDSTSNSNEDNSGSGNDNDSDDDGNDNKSEDNENRSGSNDNNNDSNSNGNDNERDDD